jgi:hypothetical protein
MVVGFAADENDNRPAFFGNGLFQGRCYAINMRDKTVGFAKAQNGKEKEN